MPLIVYMTASTMEEAENIAEALVSKRLVACVNILGAIQSHFWWNGGVQNEQEVAFIAKTTEDCFDEMQSLVTEMHSYEVPCIVALPVVAGNTDFLNWIQKETSKEP